MADSLHAGVLTSFTGGELTPQLAGRVDKEEMKIGSRFVSNFIPEHQGGLKKFYGSGHIDKIIDDVGNGCRMIPFDGCGEPLCLLFVPDKVYCVTRKEMYPVDVQISLQMILGASYVQSSDVMYITNEDAGQAVITYSGKDPDTGHHIFKSDSQRFVTVPFFPLNWQGNYNGLPLTINHSSGHVIITGQQTPGTYSLDLPDVLKNVGTGKNVTDETNPSLTITSVDKDVSTGATVGRLIIELHRVREENGETVDTIVKSATIETDAQSSALENNVEVVQGGA